jgi:D-glycero-alpha-D-manno-heptose-7-phosphate kinase
MIITRTPFRISFFGGGTDFPDFYRKHGGTVLSATINKYCYITTRILPPFFDYKYRIRYSTREETKTVEDIKHPVVREVLRKFGLDHGIEMVHTSDIPAMSGIGSSSAFTVGFLQGMHALTGQMTTKRQLANCAIEIEQNILKENVGSQDQVAAAFGGLNRIDFDKTRNFFVSPVPLSEVKMVELESHLMLFFTGMTRFSSDVSEGHKRNISANIKKLCEMRDLVDEAIEILNSNSSLIKFGKLLDKNWKIKRSLSISISNSFIDDCYLKAKKSGAIGGKILGAGGGGFLLIFAEPGKHAKVKKALSNLLYVPFAFENLGSQIIMYSTIKP